MRLQHICTAKTASGVYEITVQVINTGKTPRTYTYHLTSEYYVRQFDGFYRSGRKKHGQALLILNKYGKSPLERRKQNDPRPDANQLPVPPIEQVPVG